MKKGFFAYLYYVISYLFDSKITKNGFATGKAGLVSR